MGIKGFNKWLRTNIKSAYLRQIPRIDTLFIDAKQFYYMSLDKVPESEVVPVFIECLRIIIEKFTPNDTLFLSMDGTNPAAKFQTQRVRKFERNYVPNFSYPNEETFSKSFIEEQYANIVNDALQSFLEDIIHQPNFESKKILYSSGYSPGESEHKYLDYFRQEKRKGNTVGKNHFIVSNDNDLIFLTLQYCDENFYIIKFTEKNGGYKYDYVDMNVVRRYFLNLVYTPIQNYPKRNIDETKVVQDFVALSFLLGNDFIPSFPEIETYDINAFQRILNNYVALNANSSQDYKYLIEDNCFCVKNLKEFIELLFRNDQAVVAVADTEKVREMSQMILRTFNFNWFYYTVGVPSWTFYYPFLEAPSLKVAVALMKQEGIEYFVSIKNNIVIEPFLKTLVIRPASSVSNIPWEIYKIKIPPSDIATKYWPLIGPNEKVPMFDLMEIIERYKKEIPKLSEDVLQFNKIDPPFFIYTK